MKLTDFINKINRRIHLALFLKNSKKINIIIKNLLKKNLLTIVDIGAGNRYLNNLINFDGAAKIALVDPHKSINWAFNNLRNKLNNKNLLSFYQVGIGTKTKKKELFLSRRPTGSTFINVHKIARQKKIKIDMEYFSKEKIKVNIFSFYDFLKKNLLSKPDIIKIDTEGLEIKVIKSILSCCKPTLIEIETNINSSLYGDTFSSVNKILKESNYQLKAIYPSYKGSSKPFLEGDYYYPKRRSLLEQVDCIYVRKTSILEKKIAILIGWGFIQEAFELYKKNPTKLKNKCKNKLKDFFYNLKII